MLSFSINQTSHQFCTDGIDRVMYQKRLFGDGLKFQTPHLCSQCMLIIEMENDLTKYITQENLHPCNPCFLWKTRSLLLQKISWKDYEQKYTTIISSNCKGRKKISNLRDGKRITAAWLYSLYLELRLVPENNKTEKSCNVYLAETREELRPPFLFEVPIVAWTIKDLYSEIKCWRESSASFMASLGAISKADIRIMHSTP